jgi:hypothetical protein
MNLIFYILSGFTTLIYIASLIISFTSSRKVKTPPYMRNFYFYSLVAVIIALLFWLDVIDVISNSCYNNINKISLLFHFGFLTIFTYKAIKQNAKQNIGRKLFYFLSIIVVGSIILDFIIKTHYSYAITNMCLIIVCLYYYNRLFKNIPILNLGRDSSFWVITGIFFGMSLNIPINIFNEFLFHRIPKTSYLLLISISFIGYGLMHLFFIKSFLCLTHQPRQ